MFIITIYYVCNNVLMQSVVAADKKKTPQHEKSLFINQEVMQSPYSFAAAF
jgi:hypothetical protein